MANYYSQLAAMDRPIIVISRNAEIIDWYIRSFTYGMYGDEGSDNIYFEDGVSVPVCQYAVVVNEGKSRYRPVAARTPWRREIARCSLLASLKGESKIIKYNGLSGVSREGVSFMTLCTRLPFDMDFMKYFQGNTYLYPLTEESREKGQRSLEARGHFKLSDISKELPCTQPIALNRSLVLPSKAAQRELMTDLMSRVAEIVPDDAALRRCWILAYLLQPFDIVKLALDSASRVMNKMDFVSWTMTAPIDKLSDASELSANVRNRVEILFESLYGTDDSEIGTSNQIYKDRMVRFAGRMLLSADNANSAAG